LEPRLRKARARLPKNLFGKQVGGRRQVNLITII